MPNQKLIVFFDGTWNDPQDETNVYRMARMVEGYSGATRQKVFYDEGVGTSKFTRIRGGITGYGLTENLLQGYAWLSENYTEGDEIWLFGFSRGAYTARSLAGLIETCGLLHIVSDGLMKRAEKLYRNESYIARILAGLIDCGLEHIVSDGLMQLAESYIQNKSKTKVKECAEFKKTHSRDVDQIHFLGVWDTVVAMGIPSIKTPFHQSKYVWKNTQLSAKVKHAYHAIALDEHRKIYNATLWTSDDGQLNSPQQSVEQVWFMGAHADVGGGYEDNYLSNISLNWMVEKASAAGLKLSAKSLSPAGSLVDKEPTDSYLAFLNGDYAICASLWQAAKNMISSTIELAMVIYRMGFISKAAYSALCRFSIFNKKGTFSKKLNLGRYQRQLYYSPNDEKAVNVSVHPSLMSKWRQSNQYVLPFVNHYIELDQKLTATYRDERLDQFVGAIDE